MAGAFAGFCSVMANNPIDVVKTKMQGIDAHQYKGFADCFAKVLATEGPMGFYSGVAPRLARVVLDVALTFSLFHSIKRNVTAFVASRSWIWKMKKPVNAYKGNLEKRFKDLKESENWKDSKKEDTVKSKLESQSI